MLIRAHSIHSTFKTPDSCGSSNMAHLQWFNYEGYGQEAKANYGYSQAVRIGEEIHCSGQGISDACFNHSEPPAYSIAGGWDRMTSKISRHLEVEVNQAFENVDVAVRDAGGKGWEDVYKVRSYHIGPLNDRLTKMMVNNIKAWCPNHQPLWTYLGVQALGLPDMRIEIEVVAHTNRG